MQRRVPRVAALFLEILGRLVLRADLHEFGVDRVVLAKVRAKPAFAFVNFQHGSLLSIPTRWDGCVRPEPVVAHGVPAALIRCLNYLTGFRPPAPSNQPRQRAAPPP